MNRCAPLRVTMMFIIAIGVSGVAWAAPADEMDPQSLTDEQKDLLNYAYLTLRPDLLPAIAATGDQGVVIRHARLGINYIVSLDRTKQGEARIWANRGTSPGMVKFVLQHLTRVRDALNAEQRQAFAKLMADQKLQPVTVDATSRHFLLIYTFSPNDRIEKAKTPDGQILDVVIPEQEDFKQWYTELTTGDELIKVLENDQAQVRNTACDWLIKRGSTGLDAGAKKRIADALLTRAEKGDMGSDPGYWMQAYSQVAQAEHEQRVLALLDKCSIHHVAGMVAAYAAVAPAKALDYIAKPRTDKNYPIRAIQGLGMAPDGLRLLEAARAKMPDMKWMIDEQVKRVTELRKARAEGRPENPGEAAAIEQRKKARQEAEERAKSGRKPGDYQGYDDWFADLSSGKRDLIDKALYHFVNSVYAVDLSKLTPAQRDAVFKTAYSGLTAAKTIMNRDYAGRLLVASADPKDADTLVALITPDNGRFQYPLAALIRVSPEKAQRMLLEMEYQKFSIGKIRDAAKLVPAEAIPVLQSTKAKLKSNNTVETYEKFIAELKKTDLNQ